MATSSNLWNKSNKVGTSTGEKWVEACPISTLNSALNSLLPSNARITNLKLHVNADFDCGMIFANVYLRYGWGGTSSINRELLSSTKMTSTNELEYPSGGVDITSYLSSKTSPFALSTGNGSYLAFAFSSSNVTSKTYKITSLTFEVSYETLVTVSPIIHPTGAGTVSGGGAYGTGDTVTLTAKPNNGYAFKYWRVKLSDGSGRTTILSYDNPFTDYATALEVGHELTAVFEKLPPEFTSASMTYLNKQISSSNKVICKEGFIISVAVT